jgi:uncharacterized protein (TIGR00369 family)
MTQVHEDDEILSMVHSVFEQIPFNKVLGLAIESLTADRARLKIEMKDKLVGNFIRGTLHGGVISSAMDVTGGIVAFSSLAERLRGQSAEEKMERLGRMGTIDLRVDYLRPGVGAYFIVTGYVLRAGSRVTVTRMELHNDEERLIAVGTGAYVIS